MVSCLILLAGGAGTRFNSDRPKQYLQSDDSSLLALVVTRMLELKMFDQIALVVNPLDYSKWGPQLSEFGPAKIHLVEAGDSRFESIRNGVLFFESGDLLCDSATITVHDIVRPNATAGLFKKVIGLAKEVGAAVPVVVPKDGVLISDDGKTVSATGKRGEIFLGQTPESFQWPLFRECVHAIPDVDWPAVSGTAEICIRGGERITMTDGEENNVKVTFSCDWELIQW